MATWREILERKGIDLTAYCEHGHFQCKGLVRISDDYVVCHPLGVYIGGTFTRPKLEIKNGVCVCDSNCPHKT